MAFEITRGTNISHWLSQSKRRGEERRAFFTQDDVKRIAGWGMDHIRFPVDEEQLWTEDGKRESEGFDLLGKGLQWANEAGLKVIVDLHILRSHYFMDKNPPLFTEVKEAEKFATLWRDLSAFCRGWSNEQVAYELMNEPVAQDDADWNRVYKYPYRAIRELEPERTVILGSNKWSQCATFGALDVPEGDKALILTFHFYNPMLITHYQASWVPKIAQYTGPVNYPGQPITAAEWAKLPPAMQADLKDDNRPYDAAAMERDMALPLGVAKRTGYKLYCGEFGVVKNTPDEVRVRWYQDIVRVFAKHKIAWGNWDYRGGFGLVDQDRRETAVKRGLLG